MSRSDRPTKVYIGHLSSNTSQRHVEDLFSKYGPIKTVEMKAGFAFVEYADFRDADDVIDKLNGYTFMGSPLTVQVCKGRVKENGGNPRSGERLICENLPPNCSWQDLKDWAREAGDILYADTTEERHGRGCGVIDFSERDPIGRAIRQLDGAIMQGNRITVYEDPKNRSHGGDEGRRMGDRQYDSRDAGDDYRGDTRYERPSERRDGGYRHAPESYRGSGGREKGAAGSRNESPRRSQHRSRSRSPQKREPFVGALRREYQEAAAEHQQREDDSGKRESPGFDEPKRNTSR